MRNSLRAALLACSALVATPAMAQQIQPTPPEHYTLDVRGVDLVQGTFNYSTTDLVIGQPGQGGIAMGRVWTDEGWRDNLAGTIAVSGARHTVSYGGYSDAFIKSGSTFTPVSNNGSTLTQSGSTLTYTTSDGTVVSYTTAYTSYGTTYAANGALVTSVTQANGEKLDYYWWATAYCTFRDLDDNCLAWGNAVRLEAVRNNRGYQIKFEYAQNTEPFNGPEMETFWLRRTKATGVNLAIDYCGTSPGACPSPSRTWPSVTYNPNTTYDNIGGVTDQSGRTTTYTYAVGLLSGVRYPGSTSDDIAVSYSGTKVAGVTDSSGAWAYSYADSGSTRTTTSTGPLGQALTVVSDLSIGRATSVTNALSQTTTYAYDAYYRLQRVTQPEGDYAELTYDSRGNVTQTLFVPKSGSGLANLSTSATYPASCADPKTCNQPTSTTDARGNVTDYTYDSSHGGVLTVTASAPTSGAVRPQTRISYAAQTAYYKNSSGSIVAAATSVTLPTAVSACASGTAPSCVGTASESRTTVAYGTAGVANNLLPTSVSDRDGTGSLIATTTMIYTADGDVASVDGPLSGTDDTTTYRYDTARQMVGVIGPDPDGSGSRLRPAQRYTYDSRGAVTLSEQGTVTGLTDPNWAAFSSLQQVAVAYDAYGRPTHQRFQAGGTTFNLSQTSYDASGRVECVATRMNPTTFASPPSSACTLATAGSFGPDRILKYGYNTVGQLTSSISGFASGSTITEAATYTANGLPQTLTDGNGNVSTMVYDGFDRLSRLRYPNTTGGGSSTTDYQEYTYDPNSNVLTQRNRAGTVFTSTYDALNRQTALSASASFTPVSYTYDNLNRLLTASIPTQTTTMAWDALGRMSSETGPLGTMAYQYDLAGRRTRQTWPDGFFVTNSWNLADEMTAILHGGTTQIIGFGYDDLGRRTSLTRGNGVTSSYGYDGASRLTSLSHDVGGTAADVTFGYTYNPANQILTKTTSNPSYVWTPGAGTTSYGIDGLNRVTSVNGAATAYGLNQQMTNDTVRTFNYDSAGRLLGVNGGTSTLNYDALGRVFDYVGTNGGTYIYDGNEAAGFAPVGSTSLQTRFVRGPGVDEIVAAYTSTGPTPSNYWALDERNSLVNGSDATGASTNINTYDEYGQPGSSNLGRFQYTGQQWLPDFGLYNYKARAYNPALGRFMQHDPIGYAAGANLYAYVGNDPLNQIDPLGLDTECLPTDKPNDWQCPVVEVTYCKSGWSCISGRDWFWLNFNRWLGSNGDLDNHFPGTDVLQDIGYDATPDSPQCTIASWGRVWSAAGTEGTKASIAIHLAISAAGETSSRTGNVAAAGAAALAQKSPFVRALDMAAFGATAVGTGLSLFAGDTQAAESSGLSLLGKGSQAHPWTAPVAAFQASNAIAPKSTNPPSCR